MNGQPAVGGWIVLADGSQRGGVRTSTGFTSSETGVGKPSKPITSSSFTSNDTDI